MTHAIAVCALALLVEAAVGYPEALYRALGHPVTWMGAALALLERRLNDESDAAARRRWFGAIAVGGLTLGCIALAAIVHVVSFAILPTGVAVVILALLGSTALAQRSLDAHVEAVAAALDERGIEAARAAVAKIVGRDVAQLDAGGVALAAIESLAESFADGVVAPAFWLALLGLPGAVGLKVVNTADSMIGHRTPRHEAFGWAAARTDDVAMWPAARLAAVLLVVAAALVPGASPSRAWRIMRRDAHHSPSPNAGWPEAAMAGALGVQLGGARRYAGEIVVAPTIGEGPAPCGAADIRRALRLYRVACAIEIAFATGITLVIARS